MNHQWNFYRAKSDIHRGDISAPSSEFGSMVSVRGESPRSNHKDNIEELLVLPVTYPDDNNDPVLLRETETSPKLVRKLSKDKKAFEKNHKEATAAKSPRMTRRGSTEGDKTSVELSHASIDVSKRRQELPKSDHVEKRGSTPRGDKSEKQHVRKSSLKKKKDDCEKTSEKPKKISFAEDSVPQRSGSLKERKPGGHGRPRSSSTGDTYTELP
jgi:hypothetical protein